MLGPNEWGILYIHDPLDGCILYAVHGTGKASKKQNSKVIVRPAIILMPGQEWDS